MTTPAPTSPADESSQQNAHLVDDRQQQTTLVPRRKVRVLCLHGRGTNAKVMINQTKGLRAAMGDEDAEFIFLDAPFPLIGPTDPIIERVHGQDAPFYEWWHGQAVEEPPEGETRWIWTADNFADTMAFMDEKLQEIGHLDVVVAFSQGSVLLSVLSMLSLKQPGDRPWKLCVCVGGVAPQGVQFRHLFETADGDPIRVPFPSIHVIGRADPLYEESLQLVETYDGETTMFPSSPLKKMVIFHDDGHRFPTPHKYKDLYDELAQQIYEQCRLCDADVDASARRNHALARL